MPTTTKVCNRCKEEKSVAHFYKSRSNVQTRRAVCRECISKAYNKETARLQNIKRRDSGKNGETMKRMTAKYPEKFIARHKLVYAVKMGRIKKLPCDECGDNKSEAHHPDYSKPLEVIWLCRKHHAEKHRKLNLK